MMTRALLVPAVLSLIGLSLACTSSDGTSSGTGGGGAVIADACNPVTGAGCTAAGAACDIEDSSGVFVCYPPPNAVAFVRPHWRYRGGTYVYIRGYWR